ncbi:MAG: D-alanyl-D-alanine carboxypeptidase/D-alanyl-D-alanine endopeptidase, partial [Pseudohongiellaceae bacterium]
SPPLSDVITSINKYSNNLMTRHLLLTLGAEQAGPPATVEKGVAAVNAWLATQGIDASRMRMVNGSGLSREVRVTPAFMTEVLDAGYRSLWMPEFVSSLPLNGMDGTMRNRLRGTGQRGRMHVKTGSLDGVAGVAGYVQGRSGKVYVVTGILNHELADAGPGVELLDALLGWVLQQ